MNITTIQNSIGLAFLGALGLVQASAAPLGPATGDHTGLIAVQGTDGRIGGTRAAYESPAVSRIVLCGVEDMAAAPTSMMPAIQAKAAVTPTWASSTRMDRSELGRRLAITGTSLAAPSALTVPSANGDCDAEFPGIYPLGDECANGQPIPQECMEAAQDDYKDDWEERLKPGLDELCWMNKDIDALEDKIDEDMEELARTQRWIDFFQPACDAGDDTACGFVTRLDNAAWRLERDIAGDQEDLADLEQQASDVEDLLFDIEAEVTTDYLQALADCCDQ